jgi:hypothetical protein
MFTFSLIYWAFLQSWGTLPNGHHPARDALVGTPGRVSARLIKSLFAHVFFAIVTFSFH